MQARLFFACTLSASAAVLMQCAALRLCTSKRECEPWGTSWAHVKLCSFKTTPLATTRLRAYEPHSDALFCPLGEEPGHFTPPACVPVRPYPSAIVPEMQLPDKTVPHERYCGAWLDTSPVPLQGVVRYGFKDLRARSQALRQAAAERLDTLARFSSSTNTGKFVELCRKDSRSAGSLVRSAKEAYQFLLREAGEVTDNVSAFAALGRLAAHKCPSAIAIGIRVYRMGPLVGAEDGSLHSSSDAHGALLEMGATQEEAIMGRDAVETARRYLGRSPEINTEDFSNIVHAALGKPQDYLTLRPTPHLDAVARLVRDHSGKAAHFVSATAAFCVKTAMSGLALRRGTPTTKHQLIDRVSSAPPDDASQPGFDVSEEDLFQATSATLQMTAHSGGCVALARAIFAEDTEAGYFTTVVSEYLYARLESVVEDVRRSLVRLFEESDAVKRMYTHPSRVARSINATRVRIPGAPRGSWAGSASGGPAPHTPFSSKDGAGVALLKVSASVFTRTFALAALPDSGYCDVGFAYDALDANAYHLMNCVYIMLPMCMRGFADALYDRDSLYSRFGYIVGHELAHAERLHERLDATALKFIETSHPTADRSPPSESYMRERLADIFATLAIAGSGLVAPDLFCAHVSQIWCGKYGLLSRVAPGTADHPPPNLRGDALCARAFVPSDPERAIPALDE